jgi:hypothetical protein
VIAMLAALAVAVSPSPAHRTCALSRLDACTNTNQLFYDKSFGRKVKAFLGKGTADYLYHSSLGEQQIEVLGGPPDPPTKIGNLYRFTACRPHSCPEKGAVVFDPSGTIVATAILHSACGMPHRTDDCPIHNTLAVFVSDPDKSKPIVDDLTAWAKAQVQSSYTYPGLAPDRFEGVEVFAVSNGVRKRVSPR